MNPPLSPTQPLALVIEDDVQLAEIFSKALALAHWSQVKDQRQKSRVNSDAYGA